MIADSRDLGSPRSRTPEIKGFPVLSRMSRIPYVPYSPGYPVIAVVRDLGSVIAKLSRDLGSDPEISGSFVLKFLQGTIEEFKDADFFSNKS